MKIRFLLDENLTPRLKATILRHYPMIDVLRVGDEGAPSLSTLDPDILRYLESVQRVLVTDNRKSIPGHLSDHFAGGGHHWGIFLVHKSAPIKRLADTLYVYWEVTEAEEWVDRVEWLVV